VWTRFWLQISTIWLLFCLHACSLERILQGFWLALTGLAAIDRRKAQVIELRFFGGLSVEEVAAVLKVSPDTVMRDWKLARAWLLAELKAGG